MKYSLPLSCVTICTLILSFAIPASGQSEKRRDFIEGLFRSIIESRTKPDKPPGFIVGGQPIPPVVQVPIPPNQASRQISQYRSLIGNFSQEINTLANNLGQDSIQNPSLRVYLSDLYTIRQHALQLQQSCSSVNQIALVEPQFRALDTAWRDLSFRLQFEQSLDGPCRKNVERIDQYGIELCDLFGIQADFDRILAVFIAGQTAANTSALVDLIQEQMQGHPVSVGYVQEGRQLVGLAEQFGLNVANLPLSQAIESSQEWGNAWNVYAAKLRTIQNPFLSHAMSRVTACQCQLYDLMRIQRPIDYPYLLELSSQTQLSIQTLFNQLSLSAIGRLPQNQIQALIVAQQSVASQMQGFQTSLQGNLNHDQIVRNFVNLDSSWRNVDRYLGSVAGPVASSRASVQAQMSQLREVLQVSDALDINLMLTRAAALEGLAGNLYTVIAQRAQFIPQQNYRNQLFLQTQQFLQNAKIFHAQVGNGSNQAALEQACGTLVDSWQNCSQLIQGLPSQGVQPQIYQSIERVCLQIDPSVAAIAVVLNP